MKKKHISKKAYDSAVAIGTLYASSPYISKAKKKKYIQEIWDNL